MSCADVAAKTGQHLLFCGTSTSVWTLAQFEQAAVFAHNHGVDSLLLKVADGAERWYGSDINGYLAIRDAIRTQGVGVIPYTYCYGNALSGFSTEIAYLKEYMASDGVVCADLESQWNGQAIWARTLCNALSPLPGKFLVTTFADPDEQNWQAVLRALNPCVASYLAQQYSNYLASTWSQFAENGAACLFPTLSLDQSFGPNDPVANARAAYAEGHAALVIWYYDEAVSNPGLFDNVLGAFPKRKEGDDMITINLNTAGVSQYFEKIIGNNWHCKQTNYTIGGGILSFYQQFGGTALCGLTHLGLPLSNEISIGEGRTYQRFQRGVAFYDPTHTNDNPPAAGPVYLGHIDEGPGQDPRIAPLQAQIAALQKELAAEQQPVLQQQLTTLESKLKQINQMSQV